MTSLSWLYTFMLFVFILLFCKDKTDASVARGTEFFIAFPQHPRDGTLGNVFSADLLIWNPNQQTVSLNISLRISPTFSEIRILPTSVYKHKLPDGIQLFGSTKFFKSVYVTASAPVEVQVLSTWDETNPKSMGSFLALPRDSLSQEYLIATLCFEYNCTLVVIMTQNNTVLYIDLRVTAGKSVTYNNVPYTDGDVINATGDIGDVIQVLCSICDLSGTRIRATENVAVIAGGQFTPAVSDSTTNDMVVEQFLPWSHFGSRYVLAADVIYPVSNETVKIVTNFMNTTFRFRNTCYTSSRSRQVFQFTRPSTEFVEITATQKILVARFTEPKKAGDSVMVIPLPVTTWQTSYDLSVLSQNSSETHLVLIMERVSAASIVFERNMTSAIVVKTVNISDQYASMTLALDAGNYSLRFKCNVTLPTCRPFSGYLYSYYNLYKGWSIALLPKTIGNISDEIQVVTECMSKAPNTQTTGSSNIITTLYDQTTSSSNIITTFYDQTTSSSNITTFFVQTFLDAVSSQLSAISESSRTLLDSASSKMTPTDGLSNQTSLKNDLSSPLERTDDLSNQMTVTNEISSQITFEDGIRSQKIRETDGLTTQITSSDIYSSLTLFDILLSHTLVDDVSSQTLVDDVSSQTLVDDVSSQTLVDDVSSQTLVDVFSQTRVDDVSSQTLVDDVSSQTLVDDVSSQTLVDVFSQTRVDDVSSQTLVDDVSSQTRVDDVSSQTLVDVFSQTRVDDVSSQTLVDDVSSQTLVDDVSSQTLTDVMSIHTLADDMLTDLHSTTRHIDHVTSFSDYYVDTFSETILSDATAKLPELLDSSQDSTDLTISSEFQYLQSNSEELRPEGTKTIQQVTTSRLQQDETDRIQQDETDRIQQDETDRIQQDETDRIQQETTHRTQHETEVAQKRTASIIPIEPSYVVNFVISHTTAGYVTQQAITTPLDRQQETTEQPSQATTYSKEIAIMELTTSLHIMPTHVITTERMQEKTTFTSEIQLSYTQLQDLTGDMSHTQTSVGDLQALSFTHSGQVVLSTWGDTETMIQTVSSQIIVVSTTSPKPSEQTHTYCPCSCSQAKRNNSVTRQEIQHIVAQLQEELTVKIDTISKTKRKKISVPDSRPLSIAAGSLAIIVIGTVMGVIVLFDIRYFVNTWKRFIKAQMRKKKKRHILNG